MELYLYAKSKKHITYLPDTLIIKSGGVTHSYDIQGELDYDTGLLDCHNKGSLYVYDEEEEDYVSLSNEDMRDVAALLKAPDAKITVALCLGTDMLTDGDCSEKTLKKVKGDVLTDNFGQLSFYSKEENNWVDVDFSFEVETCYDI